MKRKIFKVLACVLVLSIVMVGLVACIKDKDEGKKDNNKDDTIDINILPDMVDYGTAVYYDVQKVDYSSHQGAWEDELNDKLDEEHDNWLLEGETWVNEKYYSFGAITGEGTGAHREHRFGYLAQDGKGDWYFEDSDSANTVERIFCYSTPGQFLEALSVQGVKVAYTDGMVKYITRNDDAYNNREEYRDYEYELGKASALQDYRELEELEEIYNDWDEERISSDSMFENSEEVSDAINLKNRKISGEIFAIFGDAADQFALTAIALLEYSTYVIENVMIPAYEKEYEASKADDYSGEYDDLVDLSGALDKGYYAYLEGRETAGAVSDYRKLINYMREEVYDYDTLVYLLSFREYAEMAVDATGELETYEVKNMAEPMTLFGYHYQFRHRDYNFYDTNETYNFRDEKSLMSDTTSLGKYEYFLKLSHESYFASGPNNTVTARDEQYALDYRTIDRDHYEQAYRYSSACLTGYYEAQLEFQAIQERMDVDIYVGGSEDNGEQRYAESIGYAKQGPTAEYDSKMTKTYSQEMFKAMGSRGAALDSNLKISDVNWKYTADEMTTKRFNLVSARWLSIEDTSSLNPTQKYYKVEYEIELLKSQDYTLNHSYLKDSDFTNGLQYEIYAYSADSVRGIQQNKKNDVIYYETIQRFKRAVNEESNGYGDAYAALAEDVGRNFAEYTNLDRNYSGIDDEIKNSDGADWTGVRSNVKETLNEDYEGYSKDHNDVDEHFEKTLIRQIYICKTSSSDEGQRGGSADHCLVNNSSSHTNYCGEDYDTNWALSRLANNHERSLRYMYGQAEVEFTKMKLDYIEKYVNLDTIAAGALLNAGLGRDAFFKDDENGVRTETLNSDDDIVKVLRDGNDNFINLPTYGGEYGVDPEATGKEFTVTIKGKSYKIKFEGWYVDPQLKYKVLEDEQYSYDIELYPGYTISQQ